MPLAESSSASASQGATPRQAQVLALLVAGEPNKNIAARLRCAERTIELHVTALLRKAEAGSRSALAARFWTLR